MALEDLTGTKYIDALVSSNPASGDTRTEGDDHLRGIKNVLLLSFPNVTGAVTTTQDELNYNDVTTLGTAEASKVVTSDSSRLTKSMILDDASTVIGDTADVTKTIGFSTGGATTSTETTIVVAQTAARSITLPDATDTLVGKATTDTLTNKTFNANGTGNSLSNVDVADLANGTDGELITWSAAGAATTVAVGTSGHVLTSNGAGAAPTMQAASVAANSVGQTELDTATAITNSASNNARVLYAFSSGQYGFFPDYTISGGVGAPITAGEVLDGGWIGWGASRNAGLAGGTTTGSEERTYTGASLTTSYQTLIYVNGFREDGNSGTTTVRQLYIAASPPWNMGDGEVRQFIYLLMDSSGEVIGASISREPPWAYAGPTRLDATERLLDGRKFKDIRIPLSMQNLTNEELIMPMKAYRQTPLATRFNDQLVDRKIEITNGWKNADMDLLPSPMIGSTSGEKIVMLDPMSPLCEKIRVFQGEGENVNALFHDGYFIVDNTAINRNAPPGIMPVGFRWR